MNKPWIEKRFNKFEINVGSDDLVIVNCSANQTIEIDKLYGPLAALGVRIRLEYKGDISDWVIEREQLGDEGLDPTWIEMARWDCQLGWPDDPTS
jgi:hypothetical protein